MLLVPSDARPTKRRPPFALVARIAVSAGLLVVLWFRMPPIDLDELIPRWSLGNIALLGAGVALFLVSYACGAVRWHQMLHLLGIRAERGRVLRHTLAGQFVSVVLPGSVGGDVLRARRLAGEVGDGSGVAASVALERLTGWAVLPLFTVIGFAINGGLRHVGRASSVALLVALATWGLLGLLMIAGGHQSLGRRFGSAAAGWRRMVGTTHLGIASLRRSPREGLEVFAAGVLYSLMQISAAYLAARVLGIDQVGPTALLVFYPAVGILQVLPIAVGGLGVREWALALFLNPLGVPTERAVALGLLLYALTVATSLAGAPAFALGVRKVRTNPPAQAELVA
ncbi:MAG: flippase-like domain-containing protein [Acidimicrobiales bacterium]|nr:flippase-like domain-containing protein [Acidimicrobiales bacterium]